MTAALQKGPESQESRALGQFAVDKFDYRDQQKNLIQLNNAVGYMSGMMRKMQRGIDSANENFIQQIQGFIQDIFVLFAGGGDTGFDFGDLRYLLQMIGALFGFGSGPFPMSIFNAAWHFFSTYIIPVDNFNDLVNMIVDGIIATTLDIFGEVPILGQALQQLMVILSAVRDGLLILTGKFGALITNITDGLGEGIDYLAHILTKIFNTFIQPIIDFISRAVGGPVGRALDTIFTNIARIFGLASGADNKATALLKQAKPLWDSVDGNGDTSVNISAANVLMSITATQSRGGFIPSVMGGEKQTISCLVSKTGTVDTFHLDVYALNLSNGLDRVYTSPDLSPALINGSGNETVLFHEIAEDDWFTTTQNAYYMVIGRMTGSGTVNIQGLQWPTANTSQRPLYPGLLRNPAVGGINPDNILSSVVDPLYTRDVPYFQLGTLAGITPQEFYNDFTALSDNLWFKKRVSTGSFGTVPYQNVFNGVLDVQHNGTPGRSWCTHRFHVATNRCRVGIRFATAFESNARSTFVTLFSQLDKPTGLGFRFLSVGPNDTIYLVKVDNDSTVTDINLTPGDGNYSVGGGAPDMIYGSNDAFIGDWIYLEYDPTDGHYRGYRNPEFEDPDHRLPIIDGGSMFMDVDETTVPGLSSILKSSISRSSTILQRCNTVGGPSGVDDWILQDWKEPAA